MGAVADFAHFIEGLYLEGDDLAFHSGDFCLCPDFQSHGRGGDVLDIQHGANGGLVFLQGFRDGLTGGTFHQGHHAGGGVNQQGAGAYFCGGIRPFHIRKGFTLHANSNFHCDHNLST